MSNAAPPAWVLALPLGSGQWRFLVRAWGYGPFNNAKADAAPLPEPARAKACNATIAARSGQPKSTAAKQALALVSAGWIRRDGDGYLTLASWRAPGVFTLDAAVEAGLVVRGEAGALSWPQPASGATQPTIGPTHTTDGSTHSRGAPNPPAVHPQPTIGPTHTTDGSQSCLSSLSSPVHEVEARDPHGLDAMTANEQLAVYATPADPSTPQARAQAQLDRERAERHALIDRQQAELRLAKLDETKSLLTAACPDPWPAKVRAASESAAYHLDQSDGPAPSYGGLMTQARANYGDEAVLEVLERWESDLPGHRPRPPANKLWWRSWVPWVEGVLGIAAPKPEAAVKPGQFAMNGALRRVK